MLVHSVALLIAGTSSVFESWREVQVTNDDVSSATQDAAHHDELLETWRPSRWLKTLLFLPLQASYNHFYRGMRPLLLIQWTSVTIFALVWTRRAARAFTPPSLRAYYRATTVAQTNSARHLSTESPDEDLLRWEKMYFDGKTESSSMDEGDAIDYYSSATEVRVITFDLDNCLWRTGDTISAANDALAKFLDERNVTQPIRVENIMGELFRESKEKYSPNGGKAPVLLTKLRKDAIQRVLEEHNDYSEEKAKELADEAFEVWTKTRHDVIPSHFASSVVSCLEEIRSMPTSSGQPVLIGAVTDGNSDPRNVNGLERLV